MPTQKNIQKEIVICAAVKTTVGIPIRGHRHADAIWTIKRMGAKPSSSPNAQGFITSRNRFVNRQLGYILQKKAGIESAAPEGYDPSEELYSEDLY